MDHTAVLMSLLLACFLCLVVLSSADDVKHKKVIIKVPKKINHVHHHHVKKMHIWKHKPKEIHSVHIVEEDDHSPHEYDWKDFKKHQHFSGWKDTKPIHEVWEEEEEDDYEEELHEEDLHKKSGSQYEPVVWKGSRGHSGKKWREPSGISSGRSRGKPRINYKGDRSKRQKSHGNYEKWQEETRHSSRPKGKKTKKPSKSKGQYKPRHKPKHYRPIEKGYADYGEFDEFSRDGPVWPERKEHISWHMREPTGVSEGFRGEHQGEIDLSKAPDIPVVPAPNLEPKPLNIHPEVYGQQEGLLEPDYKHREKLSGSRHQEELPDYRYHEKFPGYSQQERFPGYSQQEQFPGYSQQEKFPGYSQQEKFPGYRNQEKFPNFRQRENFGDYRHQEELPNYGYQEKLPAFKHRERLPDLKAALNDYTKPVKLPDLKAPADYRQPGVDGFHNIQHMEGTIAGYSSHVGHNAEGDSASYQSVRFGEKIKPLHRH